MKILNVDDDLSMRIFFRNCAKQWGEVEVDEASDGDEALVAAMRCRYDLITVDLNMPGKGGLEILASRNRGRRERTSPRRTRCGLRRKC